MTGVGGATWDQQTTSKTLLWKHTQGLGSRSTATPGSAAPPQRCHSKQEGSRDRANHPDTCHTNTTAAPRTLYLCNLELWPLLQPVIHSMLSCESLTKHCLMWWRNTQSSQQGQNHTTTKLGDKDFSLKCLQFFIQIQILSGGAPPPSPGVFSLWELCSYPVTFLWAHRFLTWSPTQAKGVTLLGCLIAIKSFCFCSQGQAGHSLPPTCSGCCCSFSTT